MVDTLQEMLVDEFGDLVLRTPDAYSKGWAIPLSEETRGNFLEEMRGISSSYLGAYSRMFDRIFQSRTGRSENDVELASRAIGHDLAELFGGGFSDLLNYLRHDPFLEHIRSDFADIKLAFQINFRQIGLSVLYLATGGNPRYLSRIPVSQLEHLLGMQSHFTKTSLTVQSGEVQNPEYSAFYEVTKNACSDYTIEYSKENGFGVLRFRDIGPGIALPPERLHEIFYGFSTTEGGFGLQFARRLIEIRRGWIEVISSPAQGAAVTYSTKTGIYSVVQEPGFKGTQFKLYFPKVV